ncbi:hypothetical protein [Agrococcus baldri]|uniref:Lipoprotein n=1 Tax=Agrococcus baldri TaxID=153730 RepID=A0AA87RNA9_9MICO|nr:hypothetical protein [Agrococcus baldri]GEK81132.1 hypothetical protein ABA31_24830 [Agrococcus baldri]
MSGTTLVLRASVAAALALALAACSPSAPAQTEAPANPSASAPVTSTAPPASDPTAQDPGADERVFVSQDGAVRFTLPDGWTVDDRSAMGEASEMYDRGPGWLNELVLLDDGGAEMVWYRERYGDDAVVCDDREWPLEVPIEPYGPELLERFQAEGWDAGRVLIVGEADLATRFEHGAAPEAGAVQMGLQTRFERGGCAGVDESLSLGSRIAQVDVVADAPGAQTPDTTLGFPDAESARAWLDGEEAATLVELLSSIEFTGAPLLDAAP